MKAKMDGDQICVTSDHFENLQESPAVFLPADDRVGLALLGGEALGFGDEMQMYELLADDARSLDCPNWGRLQNGHCGPCGDCEACEIREWIS